MDTNKIRGLAEATDELTGLIADALDELDERTRPEGRPEPSTIPGCYCRECKYYREDDEIEGLGWCECPHPVANTTGFASREYGCVFGERQEAE